MSKETINQEVRRAQKISMRVLKWSDLETVVEIDKIISKQDRRSYYERKFSVLLDTSHGINSSLVAEMGDRIVGFIMGDVFFGEFGIPETSGTIDTIGVIPVFQNHGVGSEMLEQLLVNMKAVGVKKVYSLIDWDDFPMGKFLSRHGFEPSRRINLEYKMP